jgi:hypothetical protein
MDSTLFGIFLSLFFVFLLIVLRLEKLLQALSTERAFFLSLQDSDYLYLILFQDYFFLIMPSALTTFPPFFSLCMCSFFLIYLSFT